MSPQRSVRKGWAYPSGPGNLLWKKRNHWPARPMAWAVFLVEYNRVSFIHPISHWTRSTTPAPLGGNKSWASRVRTLMRFLGIDLRRRFSTYRRRPEVEKPRQNPSLQSDSGERSESLAEGAVNSLDFTTVTNTLRAVPFEFAVRHGPRAESRRPTHCLAYRAQPRRMRPPFARGKR